MLTRLPGLIDVHVHLREPGAIHKENFLSGSKAAVAGGFTTILDMPNNPIPTFSKEKLEEKIELSRNALCDIGFHFGTNGKNLTEFSKIWSHPNVFGLKIYCNHTTGEYLVDDLPTLTTIFKAWESEKPILVHAESEQLTAALELAAFYHRRLHVCHISTLDDVGQVRRAKKKNQVVSAGVCPHHLFLTNDSEKKLGSFALMKPRLGKQTDQDGLWEGLLDGTIDCVETDHAPHTKEEKQSDKPPFGVPGLETALGLLLGAVHDKKLPEEKILNVFYHAPRNIFRIPEQPQTFIEIRSDEPYSIGENGYFSKADWSPFDGWTAYGKVRRVTLRSKVIYDNNTFNPSS